MRKDEFVRELDKFFPNGSKATQSEVAEKLGVTRQRIQQARKEYNLQDRIRGSEDRVSVDVKCINCTKNIRTHHHEQNRKFCSAECFRQYRKQTSSVVIKCCQCGVDFSVKRNSYARGVKTHGVGFFCSRQCLGKYIGEHYGFKKKEEAISS